MSGRTRYQADGNQSEIVTALRAAGCSVALIQGANNARGVPDLLVGRAHPISAYITCLLEVKRPKAKGQQAGKLSEAQERWKAEWRGHPVVVVDSVEAALRAVGLD